MANTKKTNYISVLNQRIDDKKDFARENGQDSKVLDFVLDQIEVLEELGRGLTETQILELLAKQNETQVQNTCRTLKTA